MKWVMDTIARFKRINKAGGAGYLTRFFASAKSLCWPTLPVHYKGIGKKRE